MSDFLPMNRIKVEISSLDSKYWILIPKPAKPNEDETDDNGKTLERDIERDPLPLLNVKKTVLHQTYFGSWKIPLKMDEWITKKGLKVLKRNQEMQSKKELEKIKKAFRDKTEDGLDQLEQQKGKIDKMDHKLDQLLNQMQSIVTSFES
jgi:uncharacterized coiled-coil protein SlyX